MENRGIPRVVTWCLLMAGFLALTLAAAAALGLLRLSGGEESGSVREELSPEEESELLGAGGAALSFGGEQISGSVTAVERGGELYWQFLPEETR